MLYERGMLCERWSPEAGVLNDDGLTTTVAGTLSLTSPSLLPLPSPSPLSPSSLFFSPPPPPPPPPPEEDGAEGVAVVPVCSLPLLEADEEDDDGTSAKIGSGPGGVDMGRNDMSITRV